MPKPKLFAPATPQGHTVRSVLSTALKMPLRFTARALYIPAKAVSDFTMTSVKGMVAGGVGAGVIGSLVGMAGAKSLGLGIIPSAIIGGINGYCCGVPGALVGAAAGGVVGAGKATWNIISGKSFREAYSTESITNLNPPLGKAVVNTIMLPAAMYKGFKQAHSEPHRTYTLPNQTPANQTHQSQVEDK